MKEYNYSQRKGGSSRLGLKKGESLKMKRHWRLQEGGCVAATRGEQAQSTGLKHVCGRHQYLLPIPDPIAVRLYPNHLSGSSVLEWVFKLLPICFCSRPITLTGCFSECFPYLYTFGHPKGVFDSRTLPGEVLGLFMCFSQVSELHYFPSSLF